jgi:hypothetical protein
MAERSFLEARSAGRRESLDQALSVLSSDPELAQESARPGLFLVTAGRA